ncbi:hypothetical protein OG225_11715 [Nocardia sp. NBC_01377]|uniref:hypothetical protein n=1 Tax=Nocardia sp. NBC_01377 TaxID=2903595 RepID=UPI003253F424
MALATPLASTLMVDRLATEWSSFARTFAKEFDCRIDFAHVDDVDAAYILDTCAEGGPVFLTATDMADPSDPRLHSIELVDPMPAYPWSLIWRADEADKRILAAIRTLRTLSDTHLHGYSPGLRRRPPEPAAATGIDLRPCADR